MIATKALNDILRRSGRRAKRALCRFAMANGGAAAVEFALVVTPFLVLMFGIIESGMIFLVATHLEGAVSDAARQIRTGNIQDDANPINAFQALMCSKLVVAIACDSRLVVDVRPFPRFNAVTLNPFLDEEGRASGNTFNPGAAGQIVVVRVAYNWQVITPMLGELLGDTTSGRKLVTATAAFRNEPFGGAAP